LEARERTSQGGPKAPGGDVFKQEGGEWGKIKTRKGRVVERQRNPGRKGAGRDSSQPSKKNRRPKKDHKTCWPNKKMNRSP